MKAVVAAFNQEKALVGAFSVITNLRMELFEALDCLLLHLAAPLLVAPVRAVEAAIAPHARVQTPPAAAPAPCHRLEAAATIHPRPPVLVPAGDRGADPLVVVSGEVLLQPAHLTHIVLQQRAQLGTEILNLKKYLLATFWSGE